MHCDPNRIVDEGGLLECGEAVVVACSGGPDSVALLHLLHHSSLELTLHVAHLDHALRDGSAVDAAFVEELATSLRLPTTIERRDASDREGLGPAAAAREVRLEFLEEVARRVGATVIATAHQRDDQAETVLQRLLTGSGARGLGGIPPVRVVSPGLRYVRPLLDCPRDALRAWLAERDLESRDDPSNRTPTFRARLRHEAIPLLCDISGRDARPILARTAGRMAATDALLSEHSRVVDAFVSGNSTELHLAQGIDRLPAVLLHAGLAPHLAGLTKARLEDGDVLDLVQGRRHVAGLECIPLPDGRRLVRRVEPGPPLPECPVALPGTVDWAGAGLLSTSRLPRDPGALGQLARALTNGTADVIDEDGIHGPCVLRPPRPGDRIEPLGSRVPARLGHALQRRGVAAALRPRTPVLVDADGVLLVPGVVLANRVAVGPTTKRPLLVQWAPDTPA